MLASRGEKGEAAPQQQQQLEEQTISVRQTAAGERVNSLNARRYRLLHLIVLTSDREIEEEEEEKQDVGRQQKKKESL